VFARRARAGFQRWVHGAAAFAALSP